MKIAIIGSGYVGLVTGACFSEVGIDVVCIDIDQRKIENLNNGIIPIYEPGLQELIVRNKEKNRLSFSTNLASSLTDVTAVFICVGTPPDEDGSADLKHVIAVATECGKYMNDYKLILTKSTVPVGTSIKVKNAIQNELDKRGLDIPFDVASNPEFLKEGAAIQDFLKPDRIVVGVESAKAESLVQKLYKPFTLNGHPILIMDIVSAEMTKYAANSMLATKISFINDIANLCEIVGADVKQVQKGIGTDSRIGNKFIYPGIGYGGSCFPKDVKALIKTASDHQYQLKVLQAVEEVNTKQKLVLFDKIKKHFKENLNGKTIGVWGLSFKPKTDDMREAPSLQIIKELIAAGAKVQVYDPVAMDEAKHFFGNQITYCKDQYEAIIDADCLAVLTEWSEFRLPNFKILLRLMREATVFDGRNIFEKEDMLENGFSYYGIGLTPIQASNKKRSIRDLNLVE